MAGYINNGGIVTANYEADGDMKSPWPGVSEDGEVVRVRKTLTGMIEIIYPDGVKYTPQRTLYQGGVPIIYPMSGSVAADGTLSGVTFDITYPNCYLWLPIGAVYSLSPAGLHFCQMTSTTAGKVYLNNLSAGQAPDIPSVLLPVTAGAGAYTTVTAQTTIFSAAIPGGILGPNGQIDIEHNWRAPNNANGKTMLIQYGWQSALGAAITSKLSMQSKDVIRFNGDTTNWSAFGQGGLTYGQSTFANHVKQTDNTVAQNLTFSVTMAVATDFIVFHGMRIVAAPFA